MFAEIMHKSVMSNCCPETKDVYRDISEKVFDVASEDLKNLGISLISYRLEDIGYR